MSPLTYEPQLPPRTQHSVIDKQGVDWLAFFNGLCLHPESYDWRISFRRPDAEAVAYVEPGTSWNTKLSSAIYSRKRSWCRS